jgi:TonB family protein
MRALLWSAIVCGCLVGDLAAQPLMVNPVRVGGNIKPPVKTRDVRPVYPDAALGARVAGIVILEANIGTDGAVIDARVLRGVPMLNDAALEAVKQWQYEPTLLNGVPVPVIMTVTVNFTLSDGPAAGEAGGANVMNRPWPPGHTDPYLVAPDRVGHLWIGMHATELRGAMPNPQMREIPRRTPRGLTTDVEIALEPGGPAALVANIEGGRIRQIEVRSSRFRTVEGIKIGMSLGDLRGRDPGLRVVMCDRGPCAVTTSLRYTFELDAPGATASDLARIPDSALVTGVLVATPSIPMPLPPGLPPPPR